MRAELKRMIPDGEEDLVGLTALRAGERGRRAFELARQEGNFTELATLSPSGDRRAALEREIDCWRRSGVTFTSLLSPRYPGRLARIYKPPLVLFVSGDRDLLSSHKPMVAIVGSRRATSKSCRLAHDLARELAGRGAVIVSGLALGIDAAAHSGAIASGRNGSTIAVLGNGLPEIYPRSNLGLARQIVSAGGGVVSQYEPGQRPYPSNFLERNRTIAGLCSAVLVIQAAERSGSLVTARHALDENRDVLAVPGAVDDESYRGSNLLIRSGAHLCVCVDDVAAQLEGLEDSQRESTSNLSCAGSEIVKLIRAAGTIHHELLARKLGGHPGIALELMELELRGAIIRLPGDFLTCPISI